MENIVQGEFLLSETECRVELKTRGISNFEVYVVDIKNRFGSDSSWSGFNILLFVSNTFIRNTFKKSHNSLIEPFEISCMIKIT